MKKTFCLLLTLFAFLSPLAVQAAENVTSRAILILASPEKKESDARLKDYVANLRRVIPGNHESFRAAGEASGRLVVPGRTTLTLAQGHRLEVEAERVENNRVRLNVRWLRGNAVLLDQPVAATRGNPSILGGPRAEGSDVWAVMLIVE